MDNTVFLTKEGYKELEERLNYLKVTARAEVAERIRVARDFGDISENSEYDAAREEAANLEQEITKIEVSLRNAEIITKPKGDKNSVHVGSSVEVMDMEYKDTFTFKVMGSMESDPSKGIISNESPIGKALMGAKVGDIVTVNTPGRVDKYKIKSIN